MPKLPKRRIGTANGYNPNSCLEGLEQTNLNFGLTKIADWTVNQCHLSLELHHFQNTWIKTQLDGSNPVEHRWFTVVLSYCYTSAQHHIKGSATVYQFKYVNVRYHKLLVRYFYKKNDICSNELVLNCLYC